MYTNSCHLPCRTVFLANQFSFKQIKPKSAALFIQYIGGGEKRSNLITDRKYLKAGLFGAAEKSAVFYFQPEYPLHGSTFASVLSHQLAPFCHSKANTGSESVKLGIIWLHKSE